MLCTQKIRSVYEGGLPIMHQVRTKARTGREAKRYASASNPWYMLPYMPFAFLSIFGEPLWRRRSKGRKAVLPINCMSTNIMRIDYCPRSCPRKTWSAPVLMVQDLLHRSSRRMSPREEHLRPFPCPLAERHCIFRTNIREFISKSYQLPKRWL